MSYIFAVEYQPGRAYIGKAETLADVVDTLESYRRENSTMNPRRLYSDDLSSPDDALASLEAVCQEHGYSVGKSRYAVDMIVLHHFYKKHVPCELRGPNPFAAGGREVPGIPLRDNRFLIAA